MAFVRARAGSLRIKPAGGDEFVLAGEWREVSVELAEEIRPHVNVEVGELEAPKPVEPEPTKPRKAKPSDG